MFVLGICLLFSFNCYSINLTSLFISATRIISSGFKSAQSQETSQSAQAFQIPTTSNNQQSPPIHITINNNLSNAATSTAAAQAQSSAVSYNENILSNILKQATNAKNGLLTLSKKTTIISTVAVLYLYTSLNLIYLKFNLSNQKNWSNWKSGIEQYELESLERLYLAKMLITDIHKKYSDINHPQNINKSISKFLNNIKKELYLLKKYKKISNIINKLYLSKIFYLNKPLIDNLDKKIARLKFLRHVLLSWLTENSMSNSNILGENNVF